MMKTIIFIFRMVLAIFFLLFLLLAILTPVITTFQIILVLGGFYFMNWGLSYIKKNEKNKC